MLADDDVEPVYMRFARLANQPTNRTTSVRSLDTVAGATTPRQTIAVRRVCPEAPFVIPGISTQDGDIEAAMLHGTDAGRRLAIPGRDLRFPRP